MTVVHKNRNIHDAFEICIAVIADIGISTFGLDDIIAFFPYPDGMCFDAGDPFQILYGVKICQYYLEFTNNNNSYAKLFNQ